MMDVHSPEVDVAWLPPAGRATGRGAMTDDAHERSGDEKGRDEGDQAAQQRQPTTVNDVVSEPTSKPWYEPVEHS
jgi:hypothetical protein